MRFASRRSLELTAAHMDMRTEKQKPTSVKKFGNTSGRFQPSLSRSSGVEQGAGESPGWVSTETVAGAAFSGSAMLDKRSFLGGPSMTTMKTASDITDMTLPSHSIYIMGPHI